MKIAKWRLSNEDYQIRNPIEGQFAYKDNPQGDALLQSLSQRDSIFKQKQNNMHSLYDDLQASYAPPVTGVKYIASEENTS